MRLTSASTILVLCIVATGCATPPPTASIPAIEATPELTPAILPSPSFAPMLAQRYTCGVVPFQAGVLLAPGTAEDDQDAASDALRTFLASPMSGDLMPPSGWRRLGVTATYAEFANDASDGPGYVSIRFDLRDGHWTPFNWGDCQPRRVVPAGFLSLVWWLPGGVPDASDRTLTVETIIDDCKIGPPVETVLEPLIEMAATATVALTARQSGPDACPDRSIMAEGRPTTVEIELPTEVGDRALLDASSLPARDATVPPDWYFGTGG